MTSYTPGPWDYIAEIGQGVWVHVDTVDAPDVCEITCTGDNDAEAVANARLIAAAPEMLDALYQWAAAERYADSAELANARVSRDAAIAKAIGGSR